MTRRDWTPSDDGTEPSLRGVDLADVHAAPRRREPEWDAPVNSPTPWVFALSVVVVILLMLAVLGALEVFEWIAL